MAERRELRRFAVWQEDGECGKYTAAKTARYSTGRATGSDPAAVRCKNRMARFFETPSITRSTHLTRVHSASSTAREIPGNFWYQIRSRSLAPRQAVWPPSPRRRRRDCVSPVPADRTSSSRPIEASGKTLASHLRALPARNSSLELPSSQKSKTNSLNSWWPSISSFSQVSDAFKNHAEAGQPVLPRTHSPQRGHRGARDLHQRHRDSR